VILKVEQYRAIVSLPAYFRSHDREDVFDLKKSPYSWALGQEGKTYYEVLDADEEMRPLWNGVMQAMEKNMPISGMFPFTDLREQVEKEPERPFVVDIGGGRGQVLLKLQQDVPGVLGGKLILQDLSAVIDSLTPDDIPTLRRWHMTLSLLSLLKAS